MLDVIEYFDTFFAGVTAGAAHRLLARGDRFWRRGCRGRDRARLWSVLRYDFQPFTDLYLTLYDGLQKLSHALEALLGKDALIPREKSIVDVLTLDRLGADADDPLQVRPEQADGRAFARRQPAALAGLRADRRVERRDRREAVGLLRSHRPARLPWRPLAPEARQPRRRRQDQGRGRGRQPLRELLLRGKVAYLFQRYSAERELGAILLCILDGNQEVRDLSDTMTAWIDQTIGATPADRAKQKNALFLVLTKMDREFEQKAGETEESRRLRWRRAPGQLAGQQFPRRVAAQLERQAVRQQLLRCATDRHRRAADGL